MIVVAGEVGLFKPDPAVFLHALDLLDVHPNRALCVGDSEDYDVGGAGAAGMKTVLSSSNRCRESDTADYCIQGVDGLRSLLGQVLA